MHLFIRCACLFEIFSMLLGAKFPQIHWADYWTVGGRFPQMNWEDCILQYEELSHWSTTTVDITDEIRTKVCKGSRNGRQGFFSADAWRNASISLGKQIFWANGQEGIIYIYVFIQHLSVYSPLGHKFELIQDTQTYSTFLVYISFPSHCIPSFMLLTSSQCKSKT